MHRIAERSVLIWIASVACASAQVITTFAGTDFFYPTQPLPALNAPLGQIRQVALDSKGNVYVADPDNNLVIRISPDGIASIVAGNGVPGFSGDGGLATAASLTSPFGVAVDSTGNLYIADSGANRVRRVSNGVITTVAGKGGNGQSSGDNGPATAASLNQPLGVALDSAGNLYIADYGNNRVRKVSGGVITTVAGTGVAGTSGDGGPATSAMLNGPAAVVLDSSGTMYLTDYFSHRVRKVAGGTITLVTGGGTAFQDGVPASSAQLVQPVGLALDSAGNLYIADADRIRKVSGGTITTVAGTFPQGFSGDGGPATQATLNYAAGVAVDSSGNLFIADTLNLRVRKVTASTGTISTIAGNSKFRFSGDNGPAVNAALNLPSAVAVDGANNFYISDSANNRVRKVASGVISTVAGNGVFGGLVGNVFFTGPALNASLAQPEGIAVDAAGNLYIADFFNACVRKVSNGTISTAAGGGSANPGDGGSATSANLLGPTSLAVDASGALYIAEPGAHRVRKVVNGTITTVAGNGTLGFSGDAGPAPAASLNTPGALALDAAGNLYIADTGNNRIRRIVGGTITTVAGNGAASSTGDGGPATNASLNRPAGIAIDSAGSLYIAERTRIRKVSGGTISAFAGGTVSGFSGDGGPASSAQFNFRVLGGNTDLSGMAVDAAGNLFIADAYNHRIREVIKAAVSFQAAPTTLSFSGTAGGAASGARAIALSSSVAGLAYSATSNAPWLTLTPSSGTIPATLQVIADPSQLAAGSYSGVVTVNVPNAAPATQTIAASFTVGPGAQGKLAIGSSTVSFAVTQGAAPSTVQLTVSNQGAGSVDFTAAASVSTGGNWLQISPLSGSVTPAAAVTLTVTATPGSLTPGTYSGNITIASSSTGQQFNIPVTLAISAPPQKILLSQTGLTFTAVAQGGIPLPQSFGILNIGQGSLSWTATATTLSGASGWLNLDTTSGTVATPFRDVSLVNVSIDPSRLPAGEFYGQIQVRAAGASNSPQTIFVVLSMLPAGANPGPEIRPTGLIFTGIAGASPGSQDVQIGNPSGQATDYISGLIGTGLSFLPTNATVQPGQPTLLRVFPDFSSFSGGSIQRGTITLQFTDGTPRFISVLSVIAPATPGSGASLSDAKRFAAGCTPTKLLPVFALLGSGSSAPAGWPVTVSAKVVDDCGTPMTTGSVTASFSNGDLPISLVSLQDGTWTNSWQPRNASTNAVAVSLDAQIPSANLKGAAQSSIGLQGVKTLPVLSGGPLNIAALAEGPLAPGDIILLRGTGLANGVGSAAGSPGPLLAGASVAIGGRLAPLLYADSTQLLGLVPTDLPANTAQQILVQRDNNLGVPTPIIIAATHPAVLTRDGSGQGQGLVYKAAPGSTTLADSANPVKPGDSIILYATGLGATDSTGKASNPVSVFIGGQQAQVSYAGVASSQSYPPAGAPVLLGLVSSGLGGLYQITASVPGSIGNGPSTVMISSASQSSQTGVTLAITGALSNLPTITSINTAYGSADIGQNDFIEIKGANLAPAIAGPSGLSTQLGGASVMVNGKPALLYYVSPVQINALTPLDSTLGPVSVVVASNGVISASFTANLRTVTPTFLRFDASHITATHADGSLLGPGSLGAAFTPAQPGETIVTYAVGFGLPSTTLVNGSASQSGSLPTLPVCQVSGTPATVAFAGLNGFAGLYQLNLTVPISAPIGDSPVSCTYSGQTTPAVLLSVQR